MALIHLKDIHLAFGVAPVLDGIDFAIDAGERVCLIGRNGEGKSTLFKLINGTLQPDSGEVIINSSVRVAMLEQDVPETSGRILDIVMGGSRRTAELLINYNAQTIYVPMATWMRASVWPTCSMISMRYMVGI